MSEKFLRPNEAVEYLRERVGFGSYRTLAKYRTIGGGPMFRKIGRLVVYAPSDLDAWAASRMSAPMASTSDHREVA
jgi:hypothetical protein